MAFGATLLAVPLLYIVLQLRALMRWAGLSGVLAKVSAVVAAGWVALFAVQVSIDPTSHNLWPFELLMLSSGGLAWLALIGLGRWFTRAGER